MATRTLERLGIDELTVEQRLELIGEIWDSLDEFDSEGQIPDWHIDELKRRRASAEANPDAGMAWEDVKSKFVV